MPKYPPKADAAKERETIISESIFGVDVSVIEIDARQHFSTSIAKLSEY